MTNVRDAQGDRDTGTILVLVLIVTILLSVTVIGMANYSSTMLRAGQVSELRADRLSAADGAMRDALEKMRLSRSLCTTRLGFNGVQTSFGQAINGSDAVVDCEWLNVDIDTVHAWALVITGEGVTSGNTSFTASQGNGVIKFVGGPVYVADTSEISLSAVVQIEESDLFHTTATCPTNGTFTHLTIPNLTFSPTTVRGTICVQSTWQDLFGATGPTLPDLDALPSRTSTEYTTVGTCRVFSPGVYTTMPSIDTNGANYFKNGNYVFENVLFSVDHVNAKITAGQPNDDLDMTQAISNPGCDAARNADTGDPGATFYLDGSSRIDINKGAVEIMGRRQGTAIVAVQALSTSTRTVANTAIIVTASGENKEFVANGMVWAPYARIELGNVTNRSAVQLHGGAVAAKFHIGANASVSNFGMQVPVYPLTQTLVLTSTATKDGGTTSIRTVVEYRAPREVAVKSWRVVR